jgi:PEP-CTERM motif
VVTAVKLTPLSALLTIGALAAVFSPFNAKAETTYETFNYPGGPNGNLITGVRGYDNSQNLVFLTGSYETGVDGNTMSLLFQGSIDTQVGTWRAFNPEFSGQTVTSSTLYGPNSFLYDPSLGPGGVRAVGSYKYSQASEPAADHGFIYQGTISGGTFTQIDAPSSIVGGAAVINTIAHSTMGKLVVGNFDTELDTGHAFIYNLDPTDGQAQWVNFNPTDGAVSVTAYGIWQNGSSDIYTIAGGYSDLNNGGVDAGYLVDYNLADGTWANFKSYQFEENPISSLISHFDGITLADDGSFHLTGDQISVESEEELGFFASVRRNEDGSFGEAIWTSINYPDAVVTSGNTVYKNKVLGIFEDGENPTQSYVATVPEPSTWALIAGGVAAMALLRRKRKA